MRGVRRAAEAAISKIPEMIGGVRAEICERDEQWRNSAQWRGGEIHGHGEEVGDDDVIGARERVCARVADGRERDGVIAGVGVGVDDVGVRAGFAIAKVPDVIRRARAEVVERDHERRDATERAGGKIGGCSGRICDVDVAGARERVRAGRADGGERDGINTGAGVSVGRIRSAAHVAIAEGPRVIGRAGGKVRERDGQRRRAVRGGCREICDDWTCADEREGAVAGDALHHEDDVRGDGWRVVDRFGCAQSCDRAGREENWRPERARRAAVKMEVEVACAGHGEAHVEICSRRKLDAACPGALVVGRSTERLADDIAHVVSERDGFHCGVRIGVAVAFMRIFADGITARSGGGALERGIVRGTITVGVGLGGRRAQQHFHETRMLAGTETPVRAALLQCVNHQCRATGHERRGHRGALDVVVIVRALIGKGRAVAGVAVHGHDRSVVARRSARRHEVGFEIFLLTGR